MVLSIQCGASSTAYPGEESNSKHSEWEYSSIKKMQQEFFFDLLLESHVLLLTTQR